jgi:hypothetical protein
MALSMALGVQLLLANGRRFDFSEEIEPGFVYRLA